MESFRRRARAVRWPWWYRLYVMARFAWRTYPIFRRYHGWWRGALVTIQATLRLWRGRFALPA